MRGPNVVKGYWGKPEATEQTFGGGWLRTGDIGKLDEEGFCTIVDRAKDMLIRGGENIYCIEVENALFEHPAVVDAAVVGIPHHTLGEEPAAVVTLRPGMHASEAELRAFVAERLAAFKVPVRVVARDGIAAAQRERQDHEAGAEGDVRVSGPDRRYDERSDAIQQDATHNCQDAHTGAVGLRPT